VVTKSRCSRITGQVYDNFSYKPLLNANVTTTDSAGQGAGCEYRRSGRFAIESYYLALNSSFAIGVYKSDYITRTDLVAVITAEENPIRNNPVRLYQKFGAIYGHITEDTLGTALNNVSAMLTNSNNQQLTCNSGGPYDANSSAPYEPLEAGLYCPDMDDDFGTDQNGANGGGFKIKDQFLLVGTRYPVTLSKTSAACAARTAGTTNCYRTKTTYADVLLTGNNGIAGASTALLWDSWIHGTVSAGAGVLVKLYNSSNTFVAETTTNGSGQFLFDQANILRGVQYKLTFEKAGYYSRLIGLSAPNAPVLISVTNAGANDVGAVAMTALPPPSHCARGTVKDHWSSQTIEAAAVAIQDGPLNQVPSRLATRTGGSPLVTVADTTGLAPGMLVGGRGITDGTTIASVLSATQFQINIPAEESRSDSLWFSVFSGGWRTAGTNTSGAFVIEGSFANPPVRLGAISVDAGNGGARTLVTLDGPETTADLAIGLLVTGVDIPDYARISAILSATQFRISKQASAVASNVTFTFAPSRPGEISKTGYTGESRVDKQTFNFVHSGVATACPSVAFDLDSNGVGACNAKGAGPVGGTNCAAELQLYPIGIYAQINGGPRYFRHQTKQTYEKFLTEKTGLTLSGRTGDLIRTSSLPQKTYDFDAMYLHFDDTPRPLPGVREGKWSNHVPINPTSSSPVANGVLTEGIGADSRTNQWDLKSYVYYHFYAAQPGTYTIETTGSTDTHITLYSQTGSDEGSDDDSGVGSNGRITKSLSRSWYYVKVRGKNDNVFGFFDVRVTGPVQGASNYTPMISATYSTDCGINNGNLVLSWYDATGHLLYVAGPGERPSVDTNECVANATIERHGPIGDIVRGRFSGKLRPIAPTGTPATVSAGGFFNLIRTE
jgi:hypothetical protein